MPASRRKKAQLQIRPVRPQLPGPWQYLGLLPMLNQARTLTRDLPPLAYPLLALVVWRTIQSEERARVKAQLDAHREAIRRSQGIYVVRPPRKRFLLF